MALNNNNIERRLEGKGDLQEKVKLMQLAKDEADIKFDVEADIVRQLKDKFEELGKPGETFSDFIKRVDIDELVKLELSDGGKVIPISEYLKMKEKPKIKKIDLAQGDYSKLVSDLTDQDKLLIKELLRKSGVIVGDK